MKREIEGWGGVSLRNHVENAQTAAENAREIASEACELAQNCCDELAIQAARMTEIESRLAAIEGQADV